MISFVTMTLKPLRMFKQLSSLALLPVLLLGMLSLPACNSMEGTKVKTPFDGKKYMSDARHFRAVGMGQSSNLTIAKTKPKWTQKGRSRNGPNELAGRD